MLSALSILMRLMMLFMKARARPARHVELAVDPVPDDDLFLLRLDVDVARALLHRLEEERVDPPDDGGLLVGVEDVARGFVLAGPVVALELLLARLLLVDAVDGVLDAVASSDDSLDGLAEDDAQVVERLRVERVPADDVHRRLVLAHDENPVRLREGDGHAHGDRRRDRRRIDALDDRQLRLLGERRARRTSRRPTLGADR